MSDLEFFGAVIVSVFAIVDPIGALPFFAALTDGYSDQDRRVIVQRSVAVLGSVLVVFALFGRFLFAAFGFTLQAFEIAGGILLFLVAYEMLSGETARTKMNAADESEALARRDELSVVPLGIPLLAGPGSISTVMIYEGLAGTDIVSNLAVLIAIGITTASALVVLRYGQPILRRLGRVGVMALTRVMGLVLAAVGVQFILTGILAAVAHA